MPGVSLPRYHRYSDYLRERFSTPVRKVSVDAGFTCPNRDGTRGQGGCAYCVPDAFSPSRRQAHLSITEQLSRGVAVWRARDPRTQCLAYFQPFSNTYASVARLQALYAEALAVDGVVGLAIGTRPDCMDPDKVSVLRRFAETAYVQLELGLQSAKDATLLALGRGHSLQAFLDAMVLAVGHGFDICGHMITGLPGEDRDQALTTALTMVEAGITGIKIHNLHVVRGSRWARDYEQGHLELLTLEAHVLIVCDILERLPWHVTIQRLWGQAPAPWLRGPDWCRDGSRVQRAIVAELERRDTRQGALCAKDRV